MTTYLVTVMFNTRPHAMLDGFAPGDELVPSFLNPLTVDVDAPLAAAEAAFAALNDDDRPNGDSERSLSVGDVVCVSVLPKHDGDTGYWVWFACDPIGWRTIVEPLALS